jgi:hypothetical protein
MLSRLVDELRADAFAQLNRPLAIGLLNVARELTDVLMRVDWCEPRAGVRELIERDIESPRGAS